MMKCPTAKRLTPGPDIKQTRAQYDAQRKDSPVRKRYQSYAWQSLARLMRNLNPVCQRIRNDGVYHNERCHEWSALVHHLISPIDRPELMFTATNLVCLCAADHPDSAGTPEWKPNIDFVPTNLPRYI